MDSLFTAILLGLVEGLTEFLPVSSTGHLLLFSHFLAFDRVPNNVFEVVIQFGAILAVCVAYWPRLWGTVKGLPTQPQAQRFAGIILVGFLPAMVLGALLHDIIKSVLFNPLVVAWALLIGGVVILVVERLPRRPTVMTVDAMPLTLALKVGFCQALAMIPGVSRSGATIIGGTLLGMERKAAMEFSFFLAIPTMLAAASYDIYKNLDVLLAARDSFGLMAVGLLSAFLAALVVVKSALRIVGRCGFAPFGYYRIVLGAVMLVVLGGV
jgi:undecaprenyl-diphosphatase